MVVTGGGGYYDGNRVQVYNISGLVETLPNINTPRVGHACGQFLNSDGVIVSIQMGKISSRGAGNVTMAIYISGIIQHIQHYKH